MATQAADCVPAAEALGNEFQFLGKRWTALVLGHLSTSYALTDSGRALMPALEQITLWAQEHLPPDGC